MIYIIGFVFWCKNVNIQRYIKKYLYSGDDPFSPRLIKICFDLLEENYIDAKTHITFSDIYPEEKRNNPYYLNCAVVCLVCWYVMGNRYNPKTQNKLTELNHISSVIMKKLTRPRLTPLETYTSEFSTFQ